ncbi:hypothetical protein FMN63_17320 [Stappia sp. BW2]|nr:hypothetical protein FMN63_17320 [Stappia sp. BW2]
MTLCRTRLYRRAQVFVLANNSFKQGGGCFCCSGRHCGRHWVHGGDGSEPRTLAARIQDRSE